MNIFLMKILFFIFGTLLAAATSLEYSNFLRSMNDDILKPYTGQHGSKHSNRRIRDIQSTKFGEQTYETWMSHSSNDTLPVSNTRYFVSDVRLHPWDTNSQVYGHHTFIRNPLKTFSVLESQPHGCVSNSTSSVENITKSRNCLVAQNGGYFHTSTGACIGNIISDGKIIKNSHGVQNANFGITRNGLIITGYLSENDIESMDFSQLITGVIWLVRNGTSYVDESIHLENAGSEETGTLRYFADVVSARTAIGHDSQGRVVFVQVDGQTNSRGVNLPSFAKFLIEQLHLVNAINLDGGGSATLVLNGTLANYPSDHCVGAPMWRCAREVTTAICAHEPDCETGCKNGKCKLGKCNCDVNWEGNACDLLKCSHHNCSNNGICSKDGCLCNAGWHGDDCNFPCESGVFGVNCSQHCSCKNNSECDPITGACKCLPGYMGDTCNQECAMGSYGKMCQYECHCSDTCMCDHMTGECLGNGTIPSLLTLNASKCLARRKMPPVEKDDENYNSLSLLAMLVIAVASLMLSLCFNVFLLWRSLHSQSTNEKSFPSPGNQSSSSTYLEESETSDEMSSDDSDVGVTSSSRSNAWDFLLNKFSSRPKYTRLANCQDDMEMNELKL